MSAIPPTVYDTTNLDAQSAAQMVQLVAADQMNGTPFSLIGPNATAIAQGAAAANGAVTLPDGTPPPSEGMTGTAPASSMPTSFGAYVSDLLKGAPALPASAYSNLSPADQKKAMAVQSQTAFSWFNPTSWGNFGLIIFGAALGLGALLISQKETIVKIGDVAAKSAALVA